MEVLTNKSINKYNKGNMNKFITILIKAVITIFVVCILYISYKGYTSYNETIKKASEIAENWPEYRCRPSVIPFASQLTGGKVNTLTNGIECLLTFYIKPYVTAFISPFIQFFERILEVIVDLVNSVQNIRKMFHYMRESIRGFLLDIATMFYGYAKKLSYMVNRMMDTFNKIFRVFENIMYSLGYAIYTVAAIWNSPIGGVARFFCFHKNTLVTMEDNSKKYINKIVPGDKIKKGGCVLAIHSFTGKNVKMYLYDNIIVSSSHLVYENDKWIRVSNSKKSIPLDTSENEIFCLTTKTGKIMINNILFSDYLEIENSDDMNEMMNMIMDYINKEKNVRNKKITKKCFKVWGFEKDTPVKTINGVKKIKNLKIGDKLDDKNIVEGITKIYGKNIKLYNYKNTVLTGNNIVKNINNKWSLIKDVGNPISNKKYSLYNIFTTSGSIFINNIEYKDYEQVKDIKFNEKIDTYVETKLNHK